VRMQKMTKDWLDDAAAEQDRVPPAVRARFEQAEEMVDREEVFPPPGAWPPENKHLRLPHNFRNAGFFTPSREPRCSL
jgi:hypothetical protein